MKQAIPAAENSSGATLIEVTPEMIDAGFEVYAGIHPDTYWESVDRRTVERIYRAMASVRYGLATAPQESETDF